MDVGKQQLEDEEEKEAQEELAWKSDTRLNKNEDPMCDVQRAPFPHWLQAMNKDKDEHDISEVFSKCHVNIPLLTAIKQVPKIC